MTEVFLGYTEYEIQGSFKGVETQVKDVETPPLYLSLKSIYTFKVYQIIRYKTFINYGTKFLLEHIDTR